MIALCIVSALLLITNAAWWLLWGESENEIKRLKSRDHEEWVAFRHGIREAARSHKQQLAHETMERYMREVLGELQVNWSHERSELDQLIDDVEQNRR